MNAKIIQHENDLGNELVNNGNICRESENKQSKAKKLAAVHFLLIDFPYFLFISKIHLQCRAASQGRAGKKFVYQQHGNLDRRY